MNFESLTEPDKFSAKNTVAPFFRTPCRNRLSITRSIAMGGPLSRMLNASLRTVIIHQNNWPKYRGCVITEQHRCIGLFIALNARIHRDKTKSKTRQMNSSIYRWRNKTGTLAKPCPRWAVDNRKRMQPFPVVGAACAVWLARYDFLLEVYGDLKSMQNRCRVISRLKPAEASSPATKRPRTEKHALKYLQGGPKNEATLHFPIYLEIYWR